MPLRGGMKGEKATVKDKSLHSVIAIDTAKGELHVYRADPTDKKKITYFTAAMKAEIGAEDFSARLSDALAKFRESHPDVALGRAMLVLSDNTVITDTVNLPPLNKRAMDASLDATLSNLYGGKHIRFNRVLAAQNKQYATYAVAGMRADMLMKLQEAFSAEDVELEGVTFAAAAATCAVTVLNPKLKNASYVLMDVMQSETRLVFVSGARTLGFYSLPFGASVLSAELYTPEDMLFDHPSAELLVLNANEKAKAKALTRADDFLSLPIEEEPQEEPENTESATPETEEDEDDEDEEIAAPEPTVLTGKQRKKTPRTLPKFMQREIPAQGEALVYENFRVFVKWALELIASNPSITAIGAPEAVYVNLPENLSFLFDLVNAEAEENGIRFLPLLEGTDTLIKENLALYGGFYALQYNRLNRFHASALDGIKEKLGARARPEKKDEKGLSFSERMKKAWEFIKKIATTEIGGKR